MLDTHDRMDGDADKALKTLDSLASEHGKLCRSDFLRRACQEVDMALCRSVAAIPRKRNQQLADVSGSMFQESLQLPELLA